MTNHTPGPWGQDHDGCVVMSGQRVIFDAAPDGASVEEARANRKLIAAAPDLLAALERAALCLEMGPRTQISENAIRQARMVIRNAQTTAGSEA